MARRDSLAWIAYLDVWGFSAMTASASPEDVTRVLRRSHEAVEAAFTNAAIKPERFILSDSTFLCYPISDHSTRFERLQACVTAVEQMMCVFAEHGLPLRGSIAYGSVTYDADLLVGSPVVRAVQLEHAIPFPLVLLPGRECIDDDGTHLHPDAPRMQDVHLGTLGTIRAALIRPNPRDSLIKLASAKAEHHALHGPYSVAYAWSQALTLLKQKA